MINFKLECVRCKLFSNIIERIEQDKLPRNKITVNYNGNGRYGNIDIKFADFCKQEDKIKILQMINEEYTKVYQDEVEREKGIRV